MIESKTDLPGAFPQILEVRGKHSLRADVGPSSGGTDSAPGPHDYFDAALIACKTVTAHWYAKKNGLPLERVEGRVERDDTKERAGVYRLQVKLAFLGPLSKEQRARLYAAVANCPVHKLMTTVDVQIETAPLDDSAA